MELSTLTPLLAAHNVKNIGVGVEEFGLEEFVAGNFFDGDLYVDVDKKTYQDMGYKRFSWLTVLLSLLNKLAMTSLFRNLKEKIAHNVWGDGLQNGGTIIVTKGGSPVLLEFRQVNPAAHVDPGEVLRELGIQDTR